MYDGFDVAEFSVIFAKQSLTLRNAKTKRIRFNSIFETIKLIRCYFKAKSKNYISFLFDNINYAIPLSKLLINKSYNKLINCKKINKRINIIISEKNHIINKDIYI